MRLSTQIMCSPWHRVVIRRFSAVLPLFICFEALCLDFSLPVLVPCDAGSPTGPGSARPRARLPACDSAVSTNAFRTELHAFFFFSGVCRPAPSADCNQIQSGIKR